MKKNIKELDLEIEKLTIDDFAIANSKYPEILHCPIVINEREAVLVTPVFRIDDILY